MRTKNYRKLAVMLGLCSLVTACGTTAQQGEEDAMISPAGDVFGESTNGEQDAAAGSTGKDAASEPEVTKAPELPEGNWIKYQFDVSETYQTVEGFGAAYTWYSNWLFETKDPEGALDALFTDAKLTVLRFKNEYEYKVDDMAPNTFAMLQYFEGAKKRAAEYGEDIKTLLCCWSPPASLKTDGDITGAATLRKNADGSYCYEEYADWWAESIEYYESYGIRIDYICIQNEVEFAADYDGCRFAPEESEEYASFAKAYLAVYDELQARFGADAPLMLGPETMSCKYTDIMPFIKEIIETRPETLYGIAHHLYVGGDGDNDANTVNPDSFMNPFMDLKQHYSEYSRWQTEYYVGQPLQTAMLVNNTLIFEDVNTYLYWSGVWDDNSTEFETGYLLGCKNSKSDYVTESGWRLTGDYYAMRHFSEFIRPGYVRVKAQSGHMDVRTSAYVSPEGDEVVLVLINSAAEPMDYHINATNFEITESYAVQSIFPEKGAGEYSLYQELGSLGTANTLELPAYSVTTIRLLGESR